MPNLSLKGECHEIKNRYNKFLVIDLKKVGLLEHIFSLF
jgi:hypothetical protein